MEKRKIIIYSIIAALVLTIGITGAVILSKINKKITPNDPSSTSQTEITEVVEKVKTAEPTSPVCINYEINEFNSSPDFSALKNLGFNSITYKYQLSQVDILKEYLKSAESNEFFTGLIINYLDDVNALLSETNVNFVIISGMDEKSDNFTDEFTSLVDSILSNDKNILIGYQPKDISQSEKSIENLCANGKIKIIFIDEKSNAEFFESSKKVWNSFPASIYMNHDLSGIQDFNSNDCENKITSISESLDMDQCWMIGFTPYDEILCSDSDNAAYIKKYIKNKETELLDKEFSITNYTSKNITVNESIITFKGTSSPLNDLKCNNELVKVAENGDFSLDVKLNVGKNEVVFEHKGETFTYNVMYNIKLIKSVSPSSETTVPGGVSVEISAIAHKNAKVTASLNGKTYTLKKGEYEGTDGEGNSKDIGEDFAYYYTTIETPESTDKVQNLGAFTVNASYSSINESKKGANIKISPNLIENTPDIPTTQSTTVQTTKETTTSTTTSTTVKTTTTKRSPETTTETTTENSSTEISGTTGENTEITESTKTTHRTTTTKRTTTEKTTETTTITTTPTTETTIKEPEYEHLQSYSYSNNYGLGTAKICEIVDNYVETFDGSTDKTYSVPNCSPLLKGTVDYVKSSAVCDGDTYYYLKAGVKVPLLREENTVGSKDTKIYHLKITDGFVMPNNNIKLVSCTSSSNRTYIKLDMNYKVAFNVTLTGQNYGSYNGRMVTVSSLSCSGLEFTFPNTETATGSFSFMNSIISNGSFSKSDTSMKMTLSFSNPGKFYGFNYKYDDDGFLLITIKHKPTSLSDMTVMLDPGHGGYDGGANCVVSNMNYSCEKKINLDIALRAKELLEAEGINVILTRSDDSFVSLSDRNMKARNYLPDIFISIHCDSSSGASAYGASSYYYRAYSQPLAKVIQEKIVSAYNTTIYGTSKSGTNRGWGFFAYKVARIEECPAVLIEYGFVSNTTECQKLQDASTREALAKATVDAIKEYYQNN